MRFYFDYQNVIGITIDDQGQDLPDVNAARSAAIRSLAEGICDLSVSDLPSQMSINVRTDAGFVLRVSTSIEVTDSEVGPT